MNVPVKSQHFRIDTLPIAVADLVANPQARPNGSRTREPVHEAASPLLVGLLGFGAVLTVVWAGGLLWMAGYALGIL